MTVPARSFLFVPGDRPDRFRKGLDSGADAVILDLEDGVPPDRKPIARETVAGWLSPDRPVFVRVNGVRTGWFAEDVEAVALPGLRGIVLPKAETAEDVAKVARMIPEGASVLPLVETAAGVLNARELAGALRVERLIFGAIDLQIDTGIQGEGEELLFARSLLVLVSRVAGILSPVDGVTTAIDDTGPLVSDVDRARRLGFGGKLCIHPRQVAPVNRGFMPSEREVSWARRVVEAVRTDGIGPIRVNGEMVDLPVVKRAQGILERSEK
jgi:citrate lyase subunit beta/citryl-CoA lyase